MDQSIQGGQVLAIDPQQIIRLSCQGPGACDLGVRLENTGEGLHLVWRMGGHLHLHEGLDIQAKRRGVQFGPVPVDEAFRLLDRVGLLHMADKRADELSGGQRQRVGICRALIQDPKLLLVDEPTASLDPKTSRQIMRLITELCQERGLAAIINIHDVALAQMFVPRVVGLRFGEIVYDGGPTGLTPDKLTEIYGEEDWEATIEKVEDEDDPEIEAAE